MALWDGRFEKGMDDLVAEFNASIGFDSRMYASDIDGSMAHVKMLAACGIVTGEERDEILRGLEEIRGEIEAGTLEFKTQDEDIHMAIESRLIEKIGDTGKKLHTARSRNDQCQVDARLYLRDEAVEMVKTLLDFEKIILAKARENKAVPAVGYTHLQHAQPVTLGFIFMAYFQMFRRDVERLIDCCIRMNMSPLGAGALAGTTFPIDREMTARDLGFAGPTENAMDSVSDRDYIIEFISCAAISMMHISRWAEEFCWWNSQEFAYIDIDDSYCTGSSIMPQKKNPDMAELLRGKTGRVYGDLMQILTVMKGTPLAYNKDFQEDKEALFDAIDTWKGSVKIFAGMLENTGFKVDSINRHLKEGFMNATDAAEHLAAAGVPFRDAHNITGRMVKYCEERGIQLEDMTEEELLSIDPRATKEALGDISIEACVAARKSFGGTAPEEVQRQIEAGEKWVESL